MLGYGAEHGEQCRGGGDALTPLFGGGGEGGGSYPASVGSNPQQYAVGTPCTGGCFPRAMGFPRCPSGGLPFPFTP